MPVVNLPGASNDPDFSITRRRKYRKRVVQCRPKDVRTPARRLDEREAGRIMCHVIRHGGKKAKIESWYRRYCAPKAGRPKEDKTAAEEAIQALEDGAAEMFRNNALLDDTTAAYQLVRELISAVLLALSLIPIGRVVRLLSRLVVRLGGPGLVAGQLERISVQAAANDARAIQMQAAANDLRFQRAVGD